MSFAGLISGVMGGAAEGYKQVAESEFKNQQELNLRKELLAAEEEKQLRIDEVTRKRAREDDEYKLSDGRVDLESRADLRRGTNAAATAAALAAPNAAAKRAGLEANADNVTREAELKGAADATAQAAKTTPQYLKSIAGEAAAKETSASRAAAEKAGYELDLERTVGDMRKKLSEATDPDERAILDQSIRDLSGASTKSYSDIVTAAANFRMLGQNLRKDAEQMDEMDAAFTLKRAQDYEEEAAGLMRSVAVKRGVKPKDDAPQAGSRPPLNSFNK